MYFETPIPLSESCSEKVRATPNSWEPGGTRAHFVRGCGWLADAHGLAFPDSWRQLTELLQARLSEPCVRGALTLTHSAHIFLQDVAGVEHKLTDDAVTRKELMVSALSSRASPQGPRYPAIVPAALDGYVVDTEAQKYWRTISWWVLLQTWCTLHFDDHSGLLPAEMAVDETGLATKLTRSQVSGLDKQQSLRLVVVAAEAYVQHRYWLTSECKWNISCT